ncbi:PIG-L family deacetylase [Candidatus Woesearchaeota archaeon]|nr:PIG-L family deacetylase [Candidatus Woesearchaeota archaeon]MBW3017984.1 PIG-L family deacetylase [Candidatus Woesearchaeota archaeon]
MEKETVMVFCAHSDDQIFGTGGTLAKYAKQGHNIVTLIFTIGESSHPHYKKRVVAEMRMKETLEANKVIGGGDVVFFGLPESRTYEEAGKKKIRQKIVKLINKYKPNKIFTHNPDDPHVCHRDVYKITTEIIDKTKYKGEVYVFDVWNFWNIRKRGLPRLYVDISDTFSLKIKALNCFESQFINAIIPLLWSVYVRAIIHGIFNQCKYAERFYKIQ